MAQLISSINSIQLGAHCAEAMAQRDARWDGAQTQGLVNKVLGAKAFIGLKIVLAQGGQGRF